MLLYNHNITKHFEKVFQSKANELTHLLCHNEAVTCQVSHAWRRPRQ